MIETVNVLVDGGASLDVEDVDGCSVLEKATSYDDEGYTPSQWFFFIQ